MPSAINKPAPGVSFFSPHQETASGTALSKEVPSLFQPLTIRGVTFQNRIFVCIVILVRFCLLITVSSFPQCASTLLLMVISHPGTQPTVRKISNINPIST